jgi:transcriptional regulator with XRE-family HTH domain
VAENKEENLVKKTCKELGITQKELAEIMGVTERTLSRHATSKDIPKNIVNHLNLLIEDKNKTNVINSFKSSIKNIENF